MNNAWVQYIPPSTSTKLRDRKGDKVDRVGETKRVVRAHTEGRIRFNRKGSTGCDGLGGGGGGGGGADLSHREVPRGREQHVHTPTIPKKGTGGLVVAGKGVILISSCTWPTAV